MKKTLFALAALSLASGAAMAQSSVTIYGKIDIGLVLDSGNAAGKSIRVSSGETGGSRLGFKGAEDLGGGLKASFRLETGFCADSAAPATSNGASVPNFCTGSNNFMGRQAHGDLSGAFGTIIAGRQYSLSYENLIVVDPFNTGLAGDINNLVDPSGTRLNNSIRYATPSLSGFTAAAEVAFGEQTGNWEANRETGAALTYANGPAYAGFSFYDVANSNGSGAARKNYTLGGTYDFGVVKAHALVQKSTGSPTVGAAIDVLDLVGGATVPLAGGSLMASYIHHNDRTAADKDANQIGVGYMYPLSKRTSVYTAFARIKNDHGATFTVGNSTETGTGDKAFNLGVVHDF